MRKDTEGYPVERGSIMKFYLIALIALIILSGSARADSIYQVTGDLTIIGPNTNCGGAACAETIDFAFEVGYSVQVLGPAIPYIVPGTLSLDSFGPLGQFMGGGINGDPGYVPFFNSGGDEIDLLGGGPSGSRPRPPAAPPFFPSSQIFTCATDICGLDFTNLPFGELPPPGGVLLGGTADVTVTPLPEGSELVMLGITAFAILDAMKKRFNRSATHEARG